MTEPEKGPDGALGRGGALAPRAGAERYEAVLSELSGLPARDALSVLHDAARHVLERCVAGGELGAVAVPEPELFEPKRRRSKIELDPEIEEFLLSLRGRYGYVEVAKMCRERFGAARAPGKSSIARWHMKRRARRKAVPRWHLEQRTRRKEYEQ